MMKKYYLGVAFFLLSLLTYAQNEKVTVIKDAFIFNGLDEKLVKANILIKGNMIVEVSKDPFREEKISGTQIINGENRYVIPGLIDAHTHITFEDIEIPLSKVTTESDWATMNLIAAKAAERQLLRGFTTIRNMGGNAIPLAKVIDKGILPGPRIYPSGAFISQSGGHGDFGLVTDVPRTSGNLSYAERIGFTAIADGPAEVLKRVREQLRQGATQIKVMAGGGASSDFDPLDVTQYSVEEIKAAVLAAENWGTYVSVHAYTPDAMQKAIQAGVKVIEHGQLADEATIKLMAEKGVWISPQPFFPNTNTRNSDTTNMTSAQKDKFRAVQKRNEGTVKAYQWAKKYGVKTAFGTDLFGGVAIADQEGRRLAMLQQVYSPYEILRMATSTNAELLKLSGLRNPYKEGKLGVISKGAYADLIILNQNPLENIDLVADPGRNFVLIMKDGIIYKNNL